MAKLLLVALLAVSAACQSTSNNKEAAVSPAMQPKMGRVVGLHEIVDAKSRARLGFVETTKYSNGQSLHWITDSKRALRLGYITPNNRGYRYAWYGQKRSAEPDFIGADTITFNARKIIGHDGPVELVPTTLQKLADELRAELAAVHAPKDSGKAESDEDSDE